MSDFYCPAQLRVEQFNKIVEVGTEVRYQSTPIQSDGAPTGLIPAHTSGPAVERDGATWVPLTMFGLVPATHLLLPGRPPRIESDGVSIDDVDRNPFERWQQLADVALHHMIEHGFHHMVATAHVGNTPDGHQIRPAMLVVLDESMIQPLMTMVSSLTGNAVPLLQMECKADMYTERTNERELVVKYLRSFGSEYLNGVADDIEHRRHHGKKDHIA